ncbi:MAG: sigma 54-interacting transcriptional regulator [Pseudomonadota bacterium]
MTDGGRTLILGQSKAIREICKLIGSIAKTKATVLIQGESGTGKEVVARAIHENSHRAGKPFVKVNCGALAESLLESEFFGYRRGSFTGATEDRKGRFEAANGGTLLLDEIGNLSLAGQGKLLRVLQEMEFEPVGSTESKKVDVRVLASTNEDLEKAVAMGTFRDSLYYRLNVVSVLLPPLRERKEDVVVLANHFLKNFCERIDRAPMDISSEAMALLIRHDWPGNVRELKNIIEYAVMMEKMDRVRAENLPRALSGEVGPAGSADAGLSLRERLRGIERQIIVETLDNCGWVVAAAARRLGIDRRNMSYFLKKHDLYPRA